jgi:S1-C subfamily serine protease
MNVESSDEDADDLADEAMGAVVHVFCTHSQPRWGMPWQRQRQQSSASSGFVIAGRRLLTNAHSVEFATCVSVTRRGDDRKFLATVVAVGTECDLALLTVEDEAFWTGPEAPTVLTFGRLPRLQDAVAVLGYPVGGDTLSITAGVVSRIEATEYVHGATSLLACTVDAAINAGNSGGPVLNEDGACVGVAFQSMGGDAENVGYIIPTPVVAHFLADVDRAGGQACTGFPSVSFEWQPCSSPALRKSLNLPEIPTRGGGGGGGAKKQTPRGENNNGNGSGPAGGGVLITKVEPTSPMAACLRPGDVLTSFDGVPISPDGTVPFRTGERIGFDHLITQRFVGDTARVTLIREGAHLESDVTLGTHTLLIPPFCAASQPPWLVVGGCVFVAATEPYLRDQFGTEFEYESPVPLLHCLFMEYAQRVDEQCVVLAQVLAAPVNVGFDDADVAHCRLTSFNGTPVVSLPHLAQLLAAAANDTSPAGRWYTFGLGGGQSVVLDAAQCRSEAPGILAAHAIPAQASPDLMPLLGDQVV